MTSPRWGCEVVRGEPHLLYAHRPRQAGTLLWDARRWADRVHLVQGSRRITFAELERGVLRVARMLEEAGVCAGDRVAIDGPGGPEWVTTWWATLATGAVAVPCNSWWSQSGRDHALALAGPALVVGARGDVSFGDVRRVAESDAPVPAWPEQDWDGDAPALILFTAGTTGPAKGATLTHRALVAGVQNLLAPRRLLPHQIPADHPPTVSLMTLPLFHIGGVTTLGANLVCGGRLVFGEGRFDADECVALVERERVTTWGAIPTMVRRVVERAEATAPDLCSLRTLTMGGAPVPDELVARVRRVFPSVRTGVGNTYGLTEAGGHVATAAGADAAAHPGSSGRPLPTVEVRIAEGTAEILVRSPSNMSGYWGMTDDRTIDEDGWLRTGDLGRIDADGYLYVTGRAKDVIIRGGENVAAAHVERRLLEHPAVGEVAVLGLPHPDLGEEVAAAVVVAGPVDAEELRAFAGATLAWFEVPSAWWIRTEPLPTNAAGKVLKRELRKGWYAGRAWGG